jgi:hypothetical protein
MYRIFVEYKGSDRSVKIGVALLVGGNAQKVPKEMLKSHGRVMKGQAAELLRACSSSSCNGAGRGPRFIRWPIVGVQQWTAHGLASGKQLFDLGTLASFGKLWEALGGIGWVLQCEKNHVLEIIYQTITRPTGRAQ